MEFIIYDDDDVAPFLEGLEERPQRKVLQRVQFGLVNIVLNYFYELFFRLWATLDSLYRVRCNSSSPFTPFPLLVK